MLTKSFYKGCDSENHTLCYLTVLTKDLSVQDSIRKSSFFTRSAFIQIRIPKHKIGTRIRASFTLPFKSLIGILYKALIGERKLTR